MRIRLGFYPDSDQAYEKADPDLTSEKNRVRIKPSKKTGFGSNPNKKPDLVPDLFLKKELLLFSIGIVKSTELIY